MPHLDLVNVLVAESGHTAAAAIDEQEFPNPILAEIVGDTNQRNRRQAHLRRHYVELKCLDLVLVAVGAVEILQHKHWQRHSDQQEHRPRQQKSQYRRLIEPHNRQESLQLL